MSFNSYNYGDYLYIDIKKAPQCKYNGDFFMYCGYCEKIMLRSNILHDDHYRHIENKKNKQKNIPSNDEIIKMINDWKKFYDKL